MSAPTSVPGLPHLPELPELRDALRRGDVSSRELVADALKRAEATAHLGAFVSLNGEIALREASLADARIAATPADERHRLPPLLGVPTAHKDLVDVQGATTTHGSAAVPHTVAQADDPVAAALRRAGAISIGKTQVPEFGIAGYSENEIAPPARNPRDPDLTAGGSSGGTATAVAAGVIPGAIGSDAGGSIRIPAAACGLFGLKPGRDVVPADRPVPAGRPGHETSGAPRMAVSGPIGRTAAETAILYDALLGLDDEPTLAAVRATHAHPGGLTGLSVGVSLDSPFAAWVPIHFDAAALEALEFAAVHFSHLGHQVDEVSFTYDPGYADAFTAVWTANLTRLELDAGAETRLGSLARMFLERARSTPPERLKTAVTAIRSFAADAVRHWSAYDIVMTPALAFAPPRVGAFRALGPEGDYRLQCEWAPQTSMVNVAGVPAITVPVHSSDEHTRSVQLIGRPGAETLLVRLAVQLAAYRGGPPRQHLGQRSSHSR